MGICSSIPVNENIHNEIREIEHAVANSNLSNIDNSIQIKNKGGKFG